MAVALPATLEQPGTGDLARARVTLAGGASTAVYAAAFAAAAAELRVAVLRRPERLAPWCATRGVADAIVGGFFVRPRGIPLGEAGPLLVREGEPCFERALDPEGFSAGQAQFDSDITGGRHPRAALGIAPGRLLAVVCDGRSAKDAGLTLEELAALMARLGCETAINLDGGGSTSLVSGGRLRNQPRAGVDRPEPGGRAVSTALLFVRH